MKLFPKECTMLVLSFAGIVSFVTVPCRADNPTVPLVVLDSGPIIQLCASCNSSELRMAVTPKQGFQVKQSGKTREDPEVVEVSYGNLRDNSYVKQFIPRWELSTSGTPTALIIQVDAGIKKAGSYDVLLNLQPKSDPTAPRLKIQIVHPTGKLELPDKLLINRTDYWPFYVDTDRMDLEIREASDASNVIAVSHRSLTSMQGSEMVTGQLLLDDLNAPASGKPRFPAGQTQKVTYDLSGDFPLGTVTGSIRLFAPELADSVTLNFEVHSKLTKWYIVLAIVVGLSLSWLLKVYLHNVIELADARSKAATLLDQVQADWNSRLDRNFRDTIGAPMQKLQRAIEGRDASAIAQQMTPLDTTWRTALQCLATHLQTAKTALDDLRKVTDSAWILPASLLDILATSTQACPDNVDIPHIQALLAQNDPSSADKTIVDLRRMLARKFRKLGTDWHEDAVQYLHRLAEAQAGVPADILSQFKEALGKTEPQLTRINPDELVADPQTTALIDFLRGFETEYRLVRELLTEMKLRLGQEWTEFSKVLELSSQDVANPPQFSKLKVKLDTFGNDLGQAVSDPASAIKGLQQNLAEFQESWTETFKELLPSVPDPQRQQLEGLVQDQDFLGAAGIVATAKAAAKPKPENVILGDDEVIKAGAPSWPGLAGFLAPSSMTVVSSSPHFVNIPGAMATLHLKSLGQIAKAKAIQTLALALLFIVWAYGSYSRTYGGTWSDISTIFFAAFAVDITVDGLLSRIKPS